MAEAAIYADGTTTVTAEAAVIGGVAHPIAGLAGVAVREPERWPYVPGALVGVVAAMYFLDPFHLAGFLAAIAVMLAFATMAYVLPCLLVLNEARDETSVERSCRTCEKIRAAILTAAMPRMARRERAPLAKPAADG